MAQVLDQPGWTRGVDDPLTAQRFDLVRREPELAAYQSRRLLDLAPHLAAALRAAHRELQQADALALAGAAAGAVATLLAHGDPTPAGRLRAAILRAVDVSLGLAPAEDSLGRRAAD